MFHTKRTKQMQELTDINTFFFVDETKFSLNNNDIEDSIYYLAVSVKKREVQKINQQYDSIILKFDLKNGFHASRVFKEKNPNKDLMQAFCDLIISNSLKCYCFRYSKSKLYEGSKKAFLKLNNELFDFKNQEFQALFYFVQNMISHLNENEEFEPKGLLFFDRNVYGQSDSEAFEFNETDVVKRMVFLSKSKIKLIGLPDYFGYIFRIAKISQNKGELGNMLNKKSELVINCYDCLLKIVESKLFCFLDVDKWLESK